MKSILTGIAIAGTFASAVFAQELSVEVLSMKGNDAGLGAVDICTIEFAVQNDTGADIGLGLEVLPTYIAGSFSAMVAPAGTSFGRKNEVGFYGLPAGDGMQNDVQILGAVCEEIEALELVPQCQEADGTYCNDAIVISPTSVVATRMQGGALVGGAEAVAYAGPVGPLHGLIMVSTAGGVPLMTLDMFQPEGESANGSYLATASICEAAGLSAGCDLAGKAGETEFGRVRNETEASMGTRLSEADQGRLSFHWDLNTGAGFMRNIAGSLNVPITVEISQ